MSFTLNMRDVPVVASYADAENFLTRSAKDPWKGVDDEFPIINKRRNRDMGVRRKANGDIAFRYWRTDVITWHSDGSYTYEPWNSRSTCSFFNAFCPSGHYLTRDGEVLVTGDKAYPIGSHAPVKVREDEVINGVPGCFSKSVVNKAGAKKVLASTRYAEYRAWYKIMRPLLQENSYIAGWEVKDFLADERLWPKLAMCRAHGEPERLRQYIYGENAAECYEDQHYDTLPRELARQSRYRVIPAA